MLWVCPVPKLFIDFYENWRIFAVSVCPRWLTRTVAAATPVTIANVMATPMDLCVTLMRLDWNVMFNIFCPWTPRFLHWKDWLWRGADRTEMIPWRPHSAFTWRALYCSNIDWNHILFLTKRVYIYLYSPWNGTAKKKKLNCTNNTNSILSKSFHCASKSVMLLFQRQASPFTTKITLNISQSRYQMS